MIFTRPDTASAFRFSLKEKLKNDWKLLDCNLTKSRVIVSICKVHTYTKMAIWHLAIWQNVCSDQFHHSRIEVLQIDNLLIKG
jgi:hypothetical protein